MKIIIKLFVISSFLFSQDDYYEFIITPDEPEFGLTYGAYLSINENEFVIPTIDLDNSTDVTKFYHQVEGDWVLSQELVYDNTGRHLLDDDLLFISDSYNDGRICIFENNDDEWVNSGQCITNPNPYNYRNFGELFHRSGDLLITQSRDREASQRIIYVYRRTNESWIQEFSTQLEELSTGKIFINEDFFAVGMIGLDISGEESNEGAVQFYIRDGDNWIVDSLLFSPNPNINGEFGVSIDFYQSQIFITDKRNNGGAIQVYDFVDGEISHNQTIISSDIALGDDFGNKIKVHDNYLITNAWKNDDAGPSTGAVYVFQKNDVGIWEEVRKIVSSDAETLDIFGSNFAFNSNHIIIGASFKNNMSGSVYVYELEDFSLHSNFATYPVTGNAPLTLTFNDLSQGNPTSWQWDFDSDGIIDSEDQYPEHTYEFSGDYTVTLTVTNEEETSTFTKENYVSVSGGLAYGDVNGDTAVDVIDIVIMVDVIMGEIEPTTTQIEAADMNNSGTIDVIDIVLVVNEIMGN